MRHYAKIAVLVLVIFCACTGTVSALLNTKVIEDFESRSLDKWWTFDNVETIIVENKNPKVPGRYSLKMTGETSNYYAGGCGKYLGWDVTFFNGLELNICGTGPESGTLKIELYDDDKATPAGGQGAWKTKYDKNWIPAKDDLWICEIPITWKGWKRLYIPFTDLKLSNPGRGNGIWDPYQSGQSGGLLQIQLIALTAEKEGRVDFAVDNLKFTDKIVKTKPYSIDNFRDDNYDKNPTWWKFGNLDLSVNNMTLMLSGKTTSWYIGGCGTYLGINAEKYSGIEMDIFGTGRESGSLRLEFYDDDKGGWKTEYDENWIPLKDDIFTYSINVNWEGWKHVIVPLTHLKLANPGRGNGIWDPNQNGTSGGLLQLQLILSARSKEGAANLGVTNLKLIPVEVGEN